MDKDSFNQNDAESDEKEAYLVISKGLTCDHLQSDGVRPPRFKCTGSLPTVLPLTQSRNRSITRSVAEYTIIPVDPLGETVAVIRNRHPEGCFTMTMGLNIIGE